MAASFTPDMRQPLPFNVNIVSLTKEPGKATTAFAHNSRLQSRWAATLYADTELGSNLCGRRAVGIPVQPDRVTLGLV